MLPKNNRSVLLATLAVAIVLGGGYLLYSSGLVDLLFSRERLLAFIRRHEAYAAVIFVALQALQVVAAPVPGEVTGFVGGVLFGPFWGVIFSTIGLTLGSWIAFMLARLLGRPLVERFVAATTVRRYDYVMKHKGMFLAFLLFLIPGFPKDYLCYLLGLGHMRQRDFLLVSVSGRLFGTILLTLGGSYFRDQRYAAFFAIAGIGVALILVVMIYRDRFERWIRRLRALQRAKGMIASRNSRRGRTKDD